MTFHLFSTPFSHILDCHFSWQAQYLVRLDTDTCCSTPCKERFMCDKDQSRESFFVTGAVFGNVGGCLVLLRAL